MDGRIYEHVKDYLVSLCHTELEASQAPHNTFQFLLDKSTRVSPTWSVKTEGVFCFVLNYTKKNVQGAAVVGLGLCLLHKGELLIGKIENRVSWKIK